MKNLDKEEFDIKEIQFVDELQQFKAEEFKIKEMQSNVMEDFKVAEIQREYYKETKSTKKSDNPESLRKKIEGIKSSVQTATASTVSASVGVIAALGIGTIVLETQFDTMEPENFDFGVVEYTNYYVDYQEVDDNFIENVKIEFQKDLNDGFYTLVVNKSTNETKKLDNNYISFNDVDETTVFEVITKNENNTIVNSFEIEISTTSSFQYLGIGNMNYELTQNLDNSYNLEMILEEYSDDLIPRAYLSDLNGNDLHYQSQFLDNKLVIKNINDTEFNLNAFLYKKENNNYYAIQGYKINNYNVKSPIDAKLKRVEVLNTSYSYDNSIPTEVYFDGYLSETDHLDLLIYNENGDIVDEALDIIDLKYPVVFNNLPETEILSFNYILYHDGNVIKKGNYETSTAIKEEYLYASYDYVNVNPGDTLITFNKDGTYNAYFYCAFKNNSEYDMIHKIELSDGIASQYEYIGDEHIAYILNIDSPEQFSIINKVMIREDKTYYSIYDFYLASGSLGAKYENGNWDLPLNIDFYEKENKIFELSTYNKIVADTLITATLSTGQILNFVISKDSFNNYNNYPTIDLTNYEYESIKFSIKVLVNPYYGMGDYIIETGIDIVGDNFIEVILEYEFN